MDDSLPDTCLVLSLKERRKRPRNEVVVEPGHLGDPDKMTCRHHRTTIDQYARKVKCRDCGVDLDPIDVLNILAHEDARPRRSREESDAATARLKEKSRFKCAHCGKFTDCGGDRNLKLPDAPSA